MPLSFGFLSSYPPTQCGLATFTSSLADQLAIAGHRVGVVRAIDTTEPYRTLNSPVPVVQHLVRNAPHSVSLAAAALATFDVAVIQHEFGIYGGADGTAVVAVAERLAGPVIVVAYTVLARPTDHQREVLRQLIRYADAVVTVSETARRRLGSDYGTDPATVVVIPHGAPAGSTASTASTRAAPPTILSWGMLAPGRGIESMIDAMTVLRHLEPEPRYLVVGPTHAKLLARGGETYRHWLMASTIDRDVARLVGFRGTYLDGTELSQVIAQADVVALPYESRDQATSAVLAEAVAAGRPVVATAFPYAVELLSDGAGIIVPHDDPWALADALRRVLTEPGLAAKMSRCAIEAVAEMAWPAVARRYRNLADALIGKRLPATV